MRHIPRRVPGTFGLGVRPTHTRPPLGNPLSNDEDVADPHAAIHELRRTREALETANLELRRARQDNQRVQDELDSLRNVAIPNLQSRIQASNLGRVPEFVLGELAVNHFVHDISLLQNLDNTYRRLLECSAGLPLVIRGRGQITITTQSGRGLDQMVLRECWYHPGAVVNVISQPRLADAGYIFDWGIRHTSLTIRRGHEMHRFTKRGTLYYLVTPSTAAATWLPTHSSDNLITDIHFAGGRYEGPVAR